jgi:hypothetical protein
MEGKQHCLEEMILVLKKRWWEDFNEHLNELKKLIITMQFNSNSNKNNTTIM